MKVTISTTLAVMLLAFTSACMAPEGPPGPQGLPGPQGPEGPAGRPGEEGVVIEYKEIDFEEPNYNFFLEFGYQTLRSDAVLVYALWGEETVDGEFFEIWRLLPQTTFQEAGLLNYNYEHTHQDVELFLEADFSIADATLGPNVLEDWVIRVVIVPAQYIDGRSARKVDIHDYQAVKEFYNLPDKPVSKQSYKRPEIKE